MKKIRILALALSLTMLCACAANQPTGEEVPDIDQETVQPEKTSVPVYTYEDKMASRQFTDEETGILYATYSYSVPMMQIANADLLTEEALAAAQRNAAAFNEYMQSILDESISYGEEMGADFDIGYSNSWPIADEKKMTASQTGEIVTVCVECYFFSGGAHPYAFTSSHTFDLAAGKFIDPSQIGDDPESFRVKAAALLVAKAESLGEEYTAGYWDDYAEIISHWNESAVLFDGNGMTVIFAPYDLGPYAMGSVELALTYEELADAIGEGGLKLLGVLPSETNEA